MKRFLKYYSNLPAPAKASLWFIITSLIQKGVTVVTIPIFTRLLTPEQFGIFNLYQAWLSIILIIATLNLAAGVFNNGMVKYEQDREGFTSSLVGLSTALTVVFLFIYLLFKEFWNELFSLPTEVMIVMFAQILANAAFSLWAIRQRFDYKYKMLFVVTAIVAISNPLLGILAVMSAEDKGIARIYSIAIVQILVYSIIYIYLIMKGKKFFNKTYWKYALLFNLPLLPHYLSAVVLGHSDRIMINEFVGTDAVGIYSVAYSLAMFMTVLSGSINSSLLPWTYKKMKDESYAEVGKISNVVLVMVGVSVIVLIAFAPELIQIFAPPEYFEAIWVVPPVAVSVYFIFLYTLYANIQFYFEKRKFIMIASSIGALLNIILNYLLIPIFGYLAAGYSTLVCYIVFSLAHFYFMRKVVKAEISNEPIYNNRFFFLFSLVVVVVSALFMSLYELTIVRYVAILAVLLLIFLKRKEVVKTIQPLLKKQNS